MAPLRHGLGTLAFLCASAGLTLTMQAHAQTAAPAAAAASQPAGPPVRAEFGKPLQEAIALLNAGKPKEGLAKLDEVAAVPDLTPYETMLLERNRGAMAIRLGDNALAIKSLEAAIATGLVTIPDEVTLSEVLVSFSFRDKDYPRVLKWSQRYIDLKGTNDSVRVVRIQALVSTGDERGALAALQERLAAADRAGTAMPEAQLRLLYNLQQRTKDAGAPKTLERLATTYPRTEYWSDMVVAASSGVGDNDRALAELYRLLRSVGALTSAELRFGLADTALRVGQPTEALVVLDEGYAAGVLGTGTQAAAHQKAREQARKQSAADVADRAAAETAARRVADGSALVQLGWSMVAALPTGAAPALAEPGLALIEQGVAKGSLKRPAEAQLHLGMAQLAAGRKDAARLTLAALAKTEGAKEGLAEPIRLWSMWAAAPALLPKAN